MSFWGYSQSIEITILICFSGCPITGDDSGDMKVISVANTLFDATLQMVG